MASILSRLQCVKGPIDKKSAMAQVITWRRTGGKPLPEPVLTQPVDACMRHQGEMSFDKAKQTCWFPDYSDSRCVSNWNMISRRLGMFNWLIVTVHLFTARLMEFDIHSFWVKGINRNYLTFDCHVPAWLLHSWTKVYRLFINELITKKINN